MSEWKPHWHRPGANRPKSRLVMRIELAKQAALFGYTPMGEPAKGNYKNDWTAADQKQLESLLEDKRGATLTELCELLDDHKFSHGTLNRALGKPKGTRGGGVLKERIA